MACWQLHEIQRMLIFFRPFAEQEELNKTTGSCLEIPLLWEASSQRQSAVRKAEHKWESDTVWSAEGFFFQQNIKGYCKGQSTCVLGLRSKTDVLAAPQRRKRLHTGLEIIGNLSGSAIHNYINQYRNIQNAQIHSQPWPSSLAWAYCRTSLSQSFPEPSPRQTSSQQTWASDALPYLPAFPPGLRLNGAAEN